jgi:hypothetical protein
MEYPTPFCPRATHGVPVIFPTAPGALELTTIEEVETGGAEPAALLAVKEYTPVPAAVIFVIAGLCKEELKLFGPVQLQMVASVALPVRVSVCPAQRAAKLGVAVTPVGTLCELHKLHQPERL